MPSALVIMELRSSSMIQIKELIKDTLVKLHFN